MKCRLVILAHFLISVQGRIAKRQLRNRRLQQLEACRLQIIEMSLVGAPVKGDYRTKWQCELQDADADAHGVRFVEVDGFDMSSLSTFESGKIMFYAEGANIESGTLWVPNGANVELSEAPTSRNLSFAGQDRVVLVVRVSGVDTEMSSSANDLAGSVFERLPGINNLVERYDTCSYGETTMIPAVGQDIYNGVIEVKVDTNVGGEQVSIIQNEAIRILEGKFEGNLRERFDHVMMCFPPRTLNDEFEWIAFATVNGYISSFSDDWCNVPSVQAHEIGHNLGLRHAHQNQQAYEDNTGLMGRSGRLQSTNFCFNPAHSWYLGWYGDRLRDIEIARELAFSGQLIGINNYQTPSFWEPYVVIRIRSSTGANDVFLGFNLREGINRDTREMVNKVTIAAQDDSGVSNLVEGIGSNSTYYIEEFEGDLALRIQVGEVVLQGNLPYAMVSIDLSPLAATRGDADTSSLPIITPPQPLTTAVPTAAPSAYPKCRSIATMICTSDDLALFCDAIRQGGIFDELSFGLWTVFAPVNEAFASLSSDIKISEHISRFHLVRDKKLKSSDLECKEVIEMDNGEDSRTVCRGSGVYQKGGKNPKDVDHMPMIIGSNDDGVCNGIIHNVNKVLLP